MAQKRSQSGDLWDFLVAGVTPPYTTKTGKIKAEIYGVFANAENARKKYRPKLGVLTLWEDACQYADQFEPEKCYKGLLTVRDFGLYYELGISGNKVPVETDLKLPPLREMIPKLCHPHPFKVSEAEQYAGQNFVVLRGRIRNGNVGLNSKGNNMGYLYLTDAGTPSGKAYRSYWLGHPSLATKYTSGMEVFAIVNITEPNEKFGVSLFGNFLVPVVEVPREIPSFFAKQGW